jgi:DNA polymerase
VRHWATLPETDAIDQMLQEAPTRVETMIKLGRSKPADAKPFVPIIRELPVLAQSSRSCKGCSLHCNATQTVFGEGPADAICMFIGEQPGDQEDLAGKPFVGPAGQVLNEVLIEVGIPRESLYVTNAVKHFKFEPRGTRRIHAKPNAREMAACRPWLEAEIETIRPKLIVCLGATAAQSLLGAGFRLHQHRGTTMTDTRWAPWLLATIHPSYLLRIPDVALKERTRIEFIEDLRKTAQTISTLRDIAPPVPNV